MHIFMLQKLKKLNLQKLPWNTTNLNWNKYPDWAERDDIKAQLKMDIIVVLHQYGYPPITQEDVYKNVLEQDENFKKNR